MKPFSPLILFILIAALSASCARLPRIVPDSRSVSDASSAPCTVFPSGRWQLTHVIDAIVMGEKKSGLLGVSVLSSSDRSLRCALMTVEGFVLFAGRYDGRLIVERALSPFDRPGFAKGLIDDLILLFFKPDGPLQETGVLPDGVSVCRFGAPAGGTIDVSHRDGHAWAVHKYASRHQLERSVEAWDAADTGSGERIPFPGHLRLKRHGLMGYQLDLRLFEALALP
jgi:hypothetical protein